MLTYNLFSGFIYCWLLFGTVVCFAQLPSQALPLNPVYHSKAIAIEKEALQKKDTVLLAEAYYQYFKSFSAAGDYQNAHAYFTKSLRIQEKRGETYELGRLYFYLCEMAVSTLQYEDALKHIRKSLAIAKKIQSAVGLMRAYKSLAEIHKQNWQTPQYPRRPLPRLDSAQFYYQKLLDIAKKNNNNEALAEAYEGLGKVLIDRNSPKAIGYFEACCFLFTNKVRRNSGVISVSINLLSAYTHFKKYKQATVLAQKIEDMVDTVYINAKIQAKFQQELVNLYKATQNWKKALEHSEKLNKIEYKELMDDRQGALSKLSIVYETEKKEKQIQLQQQEINSRIETEKSQRISILLALVLLAVTAVASIIFYNLYRKNQRISLKNQELVHEQNHRVKNNLQTVSSLLSLQARQLTDHTAIQAITNSQLRIQSMVILHRRLYDTEQLAHVFLPAFIKEITEAVHKTFGYAHITPEFVIENVYLHADKAIPFGLILNELVTNCCKYAYPTHPQPSLLIECKRLNDQIHIAVTDNGLHASSNESIKKTFGMKLIRAQLEQLYAQSQVDTSNGYRFSMYFKG